MTDLRQRFPIYSRLLWLYPPAYRKTYAPQMLQTLADMLDDPDRPRAALLNVHARIAGDLIMHAGQQQVTYLGDLFMHDMPTYIRRNTIIGSILLTPFVIALIANALDKLLYNHTLYVSWLWHAPFLALWALWLPLLATILALGTVVLYLLRRFRTMHSPHNIAADVRSTWPILIVVAGGLFILAVLFGHDSAHCVLGNPLQEATNLPHTWQCIQQGSATYPFQHPLSFMRRALGLSN